LTAAALAQRVQEGRMGWNDTVVGWANDIIKRDVGYNLTELFDPAHINDVTLYQLAFMWSGLNDYDDVALLKETMSAAPDRTPKDYLTKFDGSFICAPGTCHHYSSMGFFLLQYALAAESGVESWEDYNEWSFLPEHLRSQFNRTTFINHGKCIEYEDQGVAHTYMNMSKNNWPGTEIFYKDFSNLTCANGWGIGNIAISAGDAARFWYEYLGTEHIINNATKTILLENFFPPEPVAWSLYAYGGGVMWKQAPLRDGEDSSDWR
jgi:CubicO group peptidase (beta-lactamase class C family)